MSQTWKFTKHFFHVFLYFSMFWIYGRLEPAKFSQMFLSKAPLPWSLRFSPKWVIVIKISCNFWRKWNRRSYKMRRSYLSMIKFLSNRLNFVIEIKNLLWILRKSSFQHCFSYFLETNLLPVDPNGLLLLTPQANSASFLTKFRDCRVFLCLKFQCVLTLVK